MKRCLSILLAAFAMLFLSSSVSGAVEPLDDISSPITDNVNALDQDAVTLAIQEVEDQTDFRLSVVFVDSFDGMSGAMWTTRSAEASNLTPGQDILFAVATEERSYGSAYPNGTSIARNITRIEDAALPALRDGKWTDAVTAYADSVVGAATGTGAFVTSPAPVEDLDSSLESESSGVGFGSFFKALLVIVAAAVTALLLIIGVRVFYVRRSLKRKQEIEIRNVGQELVTFDEVLKQFIMNVDFMSAEFPSYRLQGVREKTAIMQKALVQAFTLMRSATNNGVSLAERYENALSAGKIASSNMSAIQQLERDFEAFRVRAQKAAEWKVEVSDQSAALKQRVLAAAATIDQMIHSTFDAKMYRSQQKTIEQIHVSLDQVSRLLVSAQKKIASSENGFAVADLEEAETLLRQGEAQVRQVDAFIESVRGAVDKAEHLLGSLRENVAWADRSKNQDRAWRAAIRRASKTLRRFENMSFASGNPLSLLGELTEECGRFDDMVERVKAEERKVQAAKKELPGAQQVAEQSVLRTQRYLNTHRTEISSKGRNQVQRLLDSVESKRSNDPVTTLAHFRQIDQSSRSTLRMLEDEVRQSQQAARRRRESSAAVMGAGAGYAYGGYSSSSSSYSSSDSSSSFGSSGGSFDSSSSGGSGGDF